MVMISSPQVIRTTSSSDHGPAELTAGSQFGPTTQIRSGPEWMSEGQLGHSQRGRFHLVNNVGRDHL